MKIIKSSRQLQSLIKKEKLKKKIIGFVPTMGYLHEGHLSLVQKSKKENDVTVVSVFVNPKQFSPSEDFQRYPRDKKYDEFLLKKEKVDIMFYPSVEEMYPSGYLTCIEIKDLSSILCGKFRPGHFKGVATVVTKLLNITAPDVMYLGQKDAQQAVILKKIILDLNFPVKVKIMPIIRESDGLAMSSRNRYLNKTQRNDAAVLFEALRHAKNLIAKNERNAAKIKKAMARIIHKKQSVTKIDYIELLTHDTLSHIKTVKGKILIAVAVWLKNTRLIDNITVNAK